MSGFKARRRYNLTPQRRKIPGVGAQVQRGRRTEILINTITIGMNIATLTFNQPVVIKGVLQFQDSTNLLPTSATPGASASQVVLHYSAVPAGPFTLGFEDPGIRNNVGGYVRPSDDYEEN